LTHDRLGDGKINVDDLEWQYLKGDGDFRSDEIKKLRDQADIIITNPPFSLFREFLAWIMEADKKFVIIGNMNSIMYREVFPLIKENKVWLGNTKNGSDMVFSVPKGTAIRESDRQKAARLGYIGNYTRLGNSCWFTNIDHVGRDSQVVLSTMADNLRYNKRLKNKKPKYGSKWYQKYDNYDAINIDWKSSIPNDYDGVMGVPITFLEVYNPAQFEIIGQMVSTKLDEYNFGYPYLDQNKIYARILIKHKK
jgi:hypothetical protein